MIDISKVKNEIERGSTALGIEFGSTRIKAVLIGSDYQPLASGSFGWENAYVDGVWTYAMTDVAAGLQSCYRALCAEVMTKYGVELTTVGSIGISAMMHGYLAFDRDGRLLAPFRTWRNTTTEAAAEILTKRFNFNIPLRWSVAHLYQAILNQEPHVSDIAFLTTLSGYVHWLLTGEKVLGVGDASGMFPIRGASRDYDEDDIASFDALIAGKSYAWKLGEILPKVLRAGENAGFLTEAGARLIDPSGKLRAGIPFCPPEGDAGTGMTATNSVAERTGNISAGTSIFAMVVLERELSRVYPEIDIVTTPAGSPVAMVHCNNCTSDIDAWSRIFGEFTTALGLEIDPGRLFTTLYSAALSGDPDCGRILTYNYLSGEPITGFDEGRPLVVRAPDSRFTLPNFMRSLIFSALGTLKIGMETLRKENVKIDRLYGHGGFFKTKEVGQRYAAAALEAPVSVMETAGEGGAWGMALLAGYLRRAGSGVALDQFLNQEVFATMATTTQEPDPADVEAFARFMAAYQAGLKIERAAIESLR